MAWLTLRKRLGRPLLSLQGDQSTVKSLLALGGDPNAPVGKKGMTAMQRAAAQDDTFVEEALYRNGGTLHPSSTLGAPWLRPARVSAFPHAAGRFSPIQYDIVPSSEQPPPAPCANSPCVSLALPSPTPDIAVRMCIPCTHVAHADIAVTKMPIAPGKPHSFPDDEPGTDKAGTFVARAPAVGPTGTLVGDAGMDYATISALVKGEDDGTGTFVLRRTSGASNASASSLEPSLHPNDDRTSSMTRALPVRMSRLSNGVASSVRTPKTHTHAHTCIIT